MVVPNSRGPEEPVNDQELFGVVHALKELVDREAEGDEKRLAS